ncbi:hypothetical protein D3C86_1726910 [compost metagenome]
MHIAIALQHRSPAPVGVHFIEHLVRLVIELNSYIIHVFFTVAVAQVLDAQCQRTIGFQAGENLYGMFVVDP